LRTAIIAVVGSKKSGKTTTIEVLVKELTKRGYKIAAVKHISEENFSIDTEGKDTWRFARAGARTIIAISPSEMATIEKRGADAISLRQIAQKCKGNDVILVEGFRRPMSEDEHVPKIVTIRSAEEASEALNSLKSILAFAGPFSTRNLNLRVPYVDVLKDPEALANLVEDIIGKES
jgi:molybdopterin-guanine dinucleotide biosynthesis protein B